MEPFLIDVPFVKMALILFFPHMKVKNSFMCWKAYLEINYGKNTYILEEGDSIYYDSIVAHHVHAAAESTAKILGVVYTPY